ncbi:hypothetical protein X946_4041 [Burkholderia sp. ABCPW 111]|nr:hypothetical protein X946_4041 [Burkholderia sp. ABCPW 111]
MAAEGRRRGRALYVLESAHAGHQSMRQKRPARRERLAAPLATHYGPRIAAFRYVRAPRAEPGRFMRPRRYRSRVMFQASCLSQPHEHTIAHSNPRPVPERSAGHARGRRSPRRMPAGRAASAHRAASWALAGSHGLA